MGSTFKIDHIVIMVEDLSVAIENYTALGFTVLEGGTHEANPTHNALVIFEDGVYLEIIALRPGASAQMSGRLKKWIQASPGLVDMALLPNDIEADITEARRRGLTIEEAQAGGRMRPDGQQIVWKTANLIGAGLPFFCMDETPRVLRVPEGEIRRHPNGVTGVANVTIAVTDLITSASQYQALLDIEPQTKATTSIPEAKTATFSLGATTITLAQPTTEASPLHAYLVNGQRPYSFTLRTKRAENLGSLDLNRTHQTRIKLVK